MHMVAPSDMNPARTKIVHLVATASGWGGLERAAVEVAAEQSRRGMDVVLLASGDVCARLPDGVAGVPFDFSASRRSPLLIWRLRRALKRLRPGLLHLHANKAAAIGKTLRVFLPGLKTVATIQNTKRSVSAFGGHDAVVAVSRLAGQSLGGLPHEVIWNAIPRPVAEDLPVDLPKKREGAMTIAAYGRFVEAKGFDLLLEAIAPLREVDLWLVGDGKLRTDIEAQIERLELGGRVWLPGFRADAEAIVSQSDLFLLPSRHEGFPFTLVEMLHRRKPVIASKVAGAEEILPEGCLVEIGDVEGLRSRIEFAQGNLDALAPSLAPVFDLARERLEIGYCCDRLNEVYQRVLL